MKSNLDRLFKTDKKLELEGVDFAIDDKTSFRVRHITPDNPKVKAAMAAYFKPYARQIQLGTLDPEKSQEINVKVFVDACLVSWEGVELDDKPAECTKENAITLFKGLPQLFQTLWDYANDFQNYREDLGNS